MISLPGKFIFVHIPKTGGTSLKQALVGYDLKNRSEPEQVFFVYAHPTLNDLEAYLLHAQLERPFFRFTVVRNPWDRLLSAFSYLEKGGSGSSWDLRKAAEIWPYRGNFRKFVLESLPNMRLAHFFLPQTHWIGEKPEQLARFDFVARYENLERDYQWLKEKLADSSELPHLRPSQHPDYRAAYDQEMQEVVARVYQKDIELLGYLQDPPLSRPGAAQRPPFQI